MSRANAAILSMRLFFSRNSSGYHLIAIAIIIFTSSIQLFPLIISPFFIFLGCQICTDGFFIFLATLSVLLSFYHRHSFIPLDHKSSVRSTSYLVDVGELLPFFRSFLLGINMLFFSFKKSGVSGAVSISPVRGHEKFFFFHTQISTPISWSQHLSIYFNVSLRFRHLLFFTVSLTRLFVKK